MRVSDGVLRRNAGRWSLPAAFDPEAERRACGLGDIRLTAPGMEGYPDLLAAISGAPELLYVRGELAAGSRALAIVGSRRPTPYGRRMARRLAGACARAGITVVSGLARGLDAEAHRAVVEAGGRTWAVLGSGLHRVYPAENRGLADLIVASGGAVISEVPLAGPPAAANFPRRNRIVAGLSWGTVVVEGDKRSGSLITARLAVEQGREVFAVPGPADSPLSEGPHELIRQGARILRRIEDVLEELPLLGAAGADEPLGAVAHTVDEKKILKLLGSESLSLEELIRETDWELSRIAHILSNMEERGLVRPLPGQRYASS